MLEYIVITGLIIGTGFYIMSPLLKPEQFNGSSASGTNEMLAVLDLKKEGAYAAIRELEFDLNMGKLSKEDYETLKEKYTCDAIDCLKAIDKLQINKNGEADLSEKGLENEIAREISALRAGESVKASDVFCAQCGQRASTIDQFCSRCGTRLIKL